MNLKYKDYTEDLELLDSLSKDLVSYSVAAKDSETMLYTRASLVHSITFAETFILIRLNEGSNIVLNIGKDGVSWVEPNVKLNLGELLDNSIVFSDLENKIVPYLYD